MIWIVVVAVVYFVLLRIYIKEDLYGDFDRATKYKMTLSTIFCAVGVWGTITVLLYGLYSSLFIVLVLCGLFCALVGDYFLRFILRDPKKFNYGICFFAGAQVFFLIAMFIEHGVRIAEFIVMIALLVAALILMKKQNWQLGSAKIPLTVYMVLLSLMMAKAVVVAMTPFFDAGSEGTISSVSFILMAVGAVLFWVSDVLLGIWKFYSRKNKFNAANSISYFTGLFLIALSINPIFFTIGY